MPKKIVKIALILTGISALGLGAVFAAGTKEPNRWIELKSESTNEVSAKPSPEKKARPNLLANIFNHSAKQKESVNFLILGVSGAGYEAPDLTDTIILARFDRTEKKVFLFSLPRDLLVQIPGSKDFTKINALYSYAKAQNKDFDWIKIKTEEITGLPIDHHVMVDLNTLKEMVDIFGGLNIKVKEDIIDTKFPGPNFSYQTFEIKSGWRYLDGETALKYARSRHSEGGDFDRIARQQEIISALKQKISGLKFWDIEKFVEIYETISTNVKTDMGLWQMKNYWNELKDLPGESIIKNEIGRDLVAPENFNFGKDIASVVIPKAGLREYSEIREFIKQTID